MATKLLIDPERYKTTLQRFEEHLTEFGKLEAAEAVRSLIKGLKIAPTVDAVEVVRCKDCEWCEQGKDYEPYCNHPTDGMHDVQPDDFCSYGERKDNG